MPAKIRLTKNRLRSLNTQLSVDDILYEKFRRLQNDLRKSQEALYRQKRIVRVIQKRGNMNYELRVLDAYLTEKGTIVVCE